MTRVLIFCLAALSFTACQGQGGADAGAVQEGRKQTAVNKGPVDLSAAEFVAKMDDPGVVILDVRTPGEVAGGMIDNAVHLDYRSPDFKQRVAELDKDKTYLVYCASGGRSGRTCELMESAGFEGLYNLEGGYGAYRAEKGL